MKKLIGLVLSISIIRGFVRTVLKILSRFTRLEAAIVHRVQQKFEWSIPPQPQWMDHFCDMFYYWEKSGNPLWIERAVFNMLPMKQGADVLDLCCGDGFYDKYFFSIRAASVIAFDYDNKAIAHARKCNQTKNVRYQLFDILRNRWFGNSFDVVIWNTAIEHFNLDEIDKVLLFVKDWLWSDGVLTGCTLVETQDTGVVHHKSRFTSKESLSLLLGRYFKNVKIIETVYPSRQNLYFFASDEKIDF